MKLNEILEQLEALKNQRGIAHWAKYDTALKSYGLGLTQLKKIGKKLPKDQDLSDLLWEQDIYDCKVLSCLCDQPELRNRQQVEERVDQLQFWMLSHVYCQNVLWRTPFIDELIGDWSSAQNNMRKQCAFAALYELAKDRKNYTDHYFMPYVEQIERELQQSDNFVRDTMNNALIAIGSRSTKLNTRCIAAAQQIGPVIVDYGDNACQALDAVKHLSSERVQKKI